MSGIFYYGINFQVRTRGIDWWDFAWCMSKSCFTCMSSHQPCSLQGFIENTTQTLRSLSLQIQNVVCAFKCPHQLAIEKMYEDYCRWPHQFNLSGKKAKMVYRPTSFAALRIMYNNGTQNIALMIFINGHVTLSGLKNIDDSRIFAQEFYSRILSNYIRYCCNKWSVIIIKFIIRISLHYNTKKNFGIFMDRE